MKQKKSVALILFLIIVFSIILVAAQDDESESPIDKAYSCLVSKLGDNCEGTQNTIQNAFNLLAMSYDSDIKSDCESSLMDKKQDSNCWGSTSTGSCGIKPTAIAIIALNNIGEDTQDYVDWLLSKRKDAKDLQWFLEIDAINKTKCKIKANGGSETTITIEENKKISGPSPSGLSKESHGYWFRITDISKNFTISCDQNFLTTVFYKKPGSNVLYIPAQTNSAPANDSTVERVESYCFSTSSTCDYEGSLWAALALQNSGEDVGAYLPYLSALSDDSTNRKYLPSAFLYLVASDSDDYYSRLISKQKQDKYWKESGDKFYDTALALLALQGTGGTEIDNAKEYLISVQDNQGCWGTNTAFLLYSGWPKAPSSSGSGGGTSDPTYCTNFGYYCVASPDCGLSDQVGESYYCPVFNDVCCKTEPPEESCEEKDGVICQTEEVCMGSTVIAGDTNYCCIGNCEEVVEENECENQGFSCQVQCSERDEEKTIYSSYCNPRVCCGAVEEPPKTTNWLLIIILIILIILVVLAIIFRNKIKLWMFKRKNKVKSKDTPPKTNRPGPGTPPPGFGGQMRPGFPGFRRPVHGPRGPMRRPMRRPVGRPPANNKKDKEFDETMKKLKEMSK